MLVARLVLIFNFVVQGGAVEGEGDQFRRRAAGGGRPAQLLQDLCFFPNQAALEGSYRSG